MKRPGWNPMKRPGWNPMKRPGWNPMKRSGGTALILFLSLAGCSLGTSAAVVPCHADRVQTSPGMLLPLASGQLYQVYPTDNHISMAWLPMDKLTVCPIGGSAVEITNLSAKDEAVRAIRIFNLPWYIQSQSS